MESRDNRNIKVALYARVSTEEQREGQTIKSQVAELERFAEQNSWDIYGRYIDEGWSGALLARPELDRLRDDAGRGFFDTVLVNDVDRLARDVMHLGVIKRDLEKKQVRLTFRKLPTSTDPMNNLMVNILGSFAEFERELIADRTRRGIRHKVEVLKQYVGCIAPYGYRYIKKSLSGNKGIFEINPKEVEVVKQMFHWVAEEGLSMNKVAERLTRLQIPTRSRKPVWKVPTVHKILRNETYAGTWHFGKFEAREPIRPRNPGAYRKKNTSRQRRAKGDWLKVPLPEELIIIEPMLWKSVQQQLDKNRRLSPRNTKFKYLLRGLLRCQFCSSIVTGRYCRDAKNTWVYYICRGCKNLRWIPRSDLESAVWNATKRALLDPKYLEARTRSALERISLSRGMIRQRQIDLSLKEIEFREAALLKEYQAGVLSGIQLAAKLEELKRAKSVVPRTSQPDRFEADQMKAGLKEYCDRIRRRVLNAGFDTKQQILRQVVSRILVTNQSVKIEGELAMTKSEFPQTASAIAYPTPTERRGSCGAIEFELKATLPCRKKTLRQKNKGPIKRRLSELNSLK